MPWIKTRTKASCRHSVKVFLPCTVHLFEQPSGAGIRMDDIPVSSAVAELDFAIFQSINQNVLLR